MLAFAAGLLGAAFATPSPVEAACESCYDILCCELPPDNLFYLTQFDGGEGMACGGHADGTWYYSTSWVRWHCGAKLRVRNPETNRCVIVEVADAGPADWVEERAGRPLLDASPLVCSELFGVGSCGWSDRFSVEVTEVADDTPAGPADCDGSPPMPPEPPPPPVAPDGGIAIAADGGGPPAMTADGGRRPPTAPMGIQPSPRSLSGSGCTVPGRVLGRVPGQMQGQMQGDVHGEAPLDAGVPLAQLALVAAVWATIRMGSRRPARGRDRKALACPPKA